MPRPHRLLASGLAAALVLTAAWLAPGCGSEPAFDASVEYTPESLAEELAFRVNTLSPSARTAEKKRGAPAKTKAAPGFVPEPASKGESKVQTKKGESQTLDDVLDDIEIKARRIRSLPAAEVFKRMADAIAEDSSVEAKDREAIVAKLDEMATAPAPR